MTEYICKICEIKFATKFNLNRHENKKIPCTPKPIKFKCDRCQKEFTTKQNLQSHLNKKNICQAKISNELIMLKEINSHNKEMMELTTNLEKIKFKKAEIDAKNITNGIKLFKLQAEKDLSVYVDALNNNNNNIIKMVCFNSINTFPSTEELITSLNFEDPTEAAKYMFKSIYANDLKSEFHSLICPNISKDDIIMLGENNFWKLDSLNDNYNNIKKKTFDLYLSKYYSLHKTIDTLFDFKKYPQRATDNIGCNTIDKIDMKKILYENRKYLDILI